MFSKRKNFSNTPIISVLLCFISVNILAQTEDNKAFQQTQNILELSIENLGEEGNFDFSTYLEQAKDLEENPIDLNNSEFEDFQILINLGLVNTMQIANLLRYREKFGQILSIYELKHIIAWQKSDIENILPYVFVSGEFTERKVSFKRQLFSGKQELFLRYAQVLEKQKGYTAVDSGSSASRYAGNPSAIYLRYRYIFRNKISYGVTMEKDPGEAFFKSPQTRGFDFYSGHLFLRNIGKVKALALGDYHANIGQGLTLWTGFSFGKSPYVLHVKRSGQILKPYTSVNENNFLRGAAASFKFGKIEITGLFSRNKIDASIQNTDSISNRATEISSFQQSGYHRTQSEIANKDALTWTLAAGHIEYQNRASKIGITAVQHFFNTDIIPSGKPYQRFYNNEKQFGNYALDYALILNKFYLFGESSLDNKLGTAQLHGFSAQLDPRVKMSAVFRYFSKDYQSFANNTFSENSRVQNETGLYWGWELSPHKMIKLQAFVDYFKFPWLRYGIDGPSAGVEYFAQGEIVLSRKVQFYLRYRYKKQERNQRQEALALNMLLPEIKQSWRAHISYRVLPFLQLKNRVEFVLFKSLEEAAKSGFLIYQDIIFSKEDFPLAANLRFAIFETESYDARIYAYENDLLYYFSIPAYSGQGIRFYCNIKWKITKNLDFWLKYAITHYADRNVISSGLAEIQGNKKSQIRAQIRMKF